MLTNEIIGKVKPIIIYPECIINGENQNCFECGNLNNCNSPRSFCLNPYHNHPKGCPNYGNKNGCPPNTPMFDEVFDMNYDIYAIITSFDLETHVNYMRSIHPEWSEYQIRNSRYWQGKDRKNHLLSLKRFIINHPELYATTWGEAMGIDICNTVKQLGINVVFPPQKETYRVSFSGKIINDYIFNQYEFQDNILVRKIY